MLLLLATAIPFAVKFFAPREFLIELEGDSGGTVLWRCHVDGLQQSGVTNLPVKLGFRGRALDFRIERTNGVSEVKLSAYRNGVLLGKQEMGTNQCLGFIQERPDLGDADWWKDASWGFFVLQEE